MEPRSQKQPQKPARKLAKQAGAKRKAKRGMSDEALQLLGFASWLLDRLEMMPAGKDRDELLADARMTLDVVREDLPANTTR